MMWCAAGCCVCDRVMLGNVECAAKSHRRRIEVRWVRLFPADALLDEELASVIENKDEGTPATMTQNQEVLAHQRLRPHMSSYVSSVNARMKRML